MLSELDKMRIRKQVELSEYRKECKKELSESKKKTVIARPYKSAYKAKEQHYYFLTINPKECEVNDLLKITELIMKRSWVKMYSYVYEQRGETIKDKGIGKHIHMIIDKSIRKSQALVSIHSAIKNYCTRENIDIREMTKNGKLIRENYMRGNKTDVKLQSVEIDKLWRKENNLEAIYTIIKEDIVDMKNINDNEINIIDDEIREVNGFKQMDIKIEEIHNKKIIKIKDVCGNIKTYELTEIN